MAVVQGASTSRLSLSHHTDQLVASSSQPLHLERHRDRFHERALRDVTGCGNESAMVVDPSNPLLIKSEMEAQKDYFRRLKFTYLEQEAKRNFLFSITGDEPQSVAPGENEQLEESNAQKKAALKEAKEEIIAMSEKAVRLAEHNAQRQNSLTKSVAEIQTLQRQIKDMELELQRIRTTYPPDHRLTPAQAEEVLDSQTQEMQQLQEQIASTSTQTESAREELSRLGKEVQRLAPQKEREEARANEVRDSREAGDTKIDELCRWLSTSISMYRSLMGIRDMKAVSDHELHLTYNVPGSHPVGLILEFETGTKRLAGARLEGSEMDIGEAVDVAMGSNDVPSLVADVRARLLSV